MEIYIEVVFLNNFMINLTILYALTFIDKIKPKIWRLATSAAIGGVFAVLYPIMNNNSFLLKLGISLLMIIILKKYKNFKEFIYTLIIFYIATFILGGGVLMLSSNGIIDLQINYKLLPFAISLVAGGMLIIGEKLYIYVNKNRKINKYLYKVKIDNYKEEQLAYYDTGNKLYYHDEGVVVISKKIFNKMNCTKIGTIEVSTINGIKELPITEISITIEKSDKIFQKFTTKAVISDNLDNKIYSIILHKDMEV